jgi:hypothetical protein
MSRTDLKLLKNFNFYIKNVNLDNLTRLHNKIFLVEKNISQEENEKMLVGGLENKLNYENNEKIEINSSKDEFTFNYSPNDDLNLDENLKPSDCCVNKFNTINISSVDAFNIINSLIETSIVNSLIINLLQCNFNDSDETIGISLILLKNLIYRFGFYLEQDNL